MLELFGYLFFGILVVLLALGALVVAIAAAIYLTENPEETSAFVEKAGRALWRCRHEVIVLAVTALLVRIALVSKPIKSYGLAAFKATGGEEIGAILFEGLGNLLSDMTGIRRSVCYYVAVGINVAAAVYVMKRMKRNKEYLASLGRTIGDFAFGHRKVLLLVTVGGLAVGGVTAAAWQVQPVRYRDYWNVPSQEPIPKAVHEAGRLTSALVERDREWQSEMDKITTRIDEERPDEFDLSKEIARAETLRAYVERLLRLGESALVSFGRMKKTAGELDLLLKDAPRKYRQVVTLAKQYAEETKRDDIKEKYLTIADIYEAKAKAAELHHKDVENNLNGDLEDYLREQNVFLERLLTMLNMGLVVSSNDLGDVARFTKTLREIVMQHEFLRDTLRAWRGRLVNEVATPPPAVPKEPEQASK